MSEEIISTEVADNGPAPVNGADASPAPAPKAKKKKTWPPVIRKVFSEYKYCWYAALFSCAIMLFVYLAYKFFPIGTTTILRMDLYHQYGPLFTEFYERVFNGDSFLYSWTSGLGSDFLGNFYNYLSSPANIIMLLAGHTNMPEAIAVMVLLKNTFAAWTFTCFIQKRFNRSDLSAAGFGVLYAFCGWYMAYYWNIMWLDGYAVFPLVMLGLEYIIDGKKPYLYLFSLFFAMITSYYMAYMICLVSFIYFFIYYFSNYELGAVNADLSSIKLTRVQYSRLPIQEKLKLFYRNLLNSKLISRGCTFAAYSVLAFLLAAFSLIPVYFILKNSSATGGSFPTDYSSYFKFFDFIANHLAGAEPTIRSSGEDVLPNIYSGVLPLILCPLYLFSKKYAFREKVATIILFAVFFFSFNINYLNYIWHGFHFPNDLPYRFSFAYSFFLLYVAYKAFACLNEHSKRTITVVGIAVIAFAVLAQKVQSKNVDDTVVIESIVFAVMYVLVLIMLKTPKYAKTAITALLVCCICTEAIVVDTANFQMTQNKENYVATYDDLQSIKGKIQDLEGDNSFYRMEQADLLTRMDDCWFYYNGVSTFSSMAYETVSKLMKKLGMYGNDVNSYTYFPQTAVFNSMFSMKYVLDNKKLIDPDGNFFYRELGPEFTNKNYTGYRYNFCLPPAFTVDKSILKSWELLDTNPFRVQSQFFEAAAGKSDIFRSLVPKVQSLTNVNSLSESELSSGNISFAKTTYNTFGSITLTVKPEISGNVYIYLQSSTIKNATYNKNGAGTGYEVETPYIYDAGHCDPGDILTIDIDLPDDDKGNKGKFTLYCVSMDENEFIEGYNTILTNGTMAVTYFDNGRNLRGYIDVADDDRLLYTSIPYDTGWTVTVDGKAVDKESYEKLGSSLLAIPITAGHHEIEFSFTPNGYYAGLALTLISLVLLIVCFIMKKKKAGLFSEASVRKIRCEDFVPSVLLYDMETAEGFDDITDNCDETAAVSDEPEKEADVAADETIAGEIDGSDSDNAESDS